MFIRALHFEVDPAQGVDLVAEPLVDVAQLQEAHRAPTRSRLMKRSNRFNSIDKAMTITM